MLGATRQELGRSDEAIDDLKDVSWDSPKHPLLLRYWGEALMQQDDYEGAASKFTKLLASTETSIDLPVSSAEMNLALAQADLGECYRRLNQLPRALNQFEQIDPVRRQEDRILSQWGWALLDAGQLDEALAKFKAAAQRNPNQAAAQAGWGETLRQKDHPGDAIEHLERATRLATKSDPFNSDAWSWYQWGLALKDLKKPSEAIGKFNQALERNFNLRDAYEAWGQALDESGRTKEAVRKFKTLKFEPDRAATWITWGQALHKLGEAQGAREKFDRALQIDPYSALALGEIGDLERLAGNFEEAATYFEKSVGMDLSDSWVLYRWGLLLVAQKKDQEAAEKFQAVLDLAPEAKDAQRELKAAQDRLHR